MFKILRGFWFGSKTKILLSLIVCQRSWRNMDLRSQFHLLKTLSLAQKGHAS